ncbi:hypothetical protein L3Q72_16175 [Vibrio sp. JC009]|uniref:hypothetical protein n=1 Tax=Vibrio sp. JC009 TaxID=2912314 RepID=UPI0023B1E3F6|nr:hypothetical protein [Vibrio sp. JC009]WED24414.1 hypothetical protein L3Q72_16175 [Vibrio sp. JC009]
MYGEKQTKAFCSECEKLTLHEYVQFGKDSTGEKQGTKIGFLKALFSTLDPGYGTGDYKCTVCGTYLHTPDYLD